MERAVRDAPWKLHLDLVDADGELVTDATAVTLAVTDLAGAGVAGSPFTVADPDSGQLSVLIPAAALTTLGVYDLEWTITRPGGAEKRRGQLEVVGAFLYGLDELRAAYDEFANADEWPARILRANRNAVEDLIESHCRPAFRRRRARATLDGTGTAELLLADLYPTELVAASIDGAALTSEELADVEVYELGVLHRRTGVWTRGARNVTVVYEHGLDEVPRDATVNAMRLAAATLVRSSTPDRATSVATDVGNFRLTVADREHPTGIPDVDAFIERWGGGNPLYVS